MTRLHAPSRRQLLLASGALFAWTYWPKLARAEGRDPRFLTIILRGALDGLATVAPVGDPDWVSLRGDDALTLDGKTPALRLDDFFALNPAMPNLHRLFKANEAIVVHAAATSYRERSHFDGQDVLESGVEKPGSTYTGWLNRTLAGLAPDGRVDPNGGKAFAVGPVAPLVVRGPAPVMSWSSPRILPAGDDTIMRLLDLYRHKDAKLARVLEGRMSLATIARDGGIEQKSESRNPDAGLAWISHTIFAQLSGSAGVFIWSSLRVRDPGVARRGKKRVCSGAAGSSEERSLGGPRGWCRSCDALRRRVSAG